jgi:hypothetical protein
VCHCFDTKSRHPICYQPKKLLSSEIIKAHTVIIAGAVVLPLPTAYLIFRANSQAAGKCWMDALELGLRCSSLLVRSSSGRDSTPHVQEANWEYEQHFADQGD